MQSEAESARAIDDAGNVTLVYGTKPAGDVIFLSTNDRGTPGELNRTILKALGLGTSALPHAKTLSAGYAIARHEHQQLCFVVTVGKGEPASLLRMNLTAALRDGRLHGAMSLWMPLMGTGVGQLSLDTSLELTRSALQETGWPERSGVRIVIAAPENSVLERTPNFGSQAFQASTESNPSDDQTAFTEDETEGNGASEDSKLTDYPKSKPVIAALDFAEHLRAGREQGGRLSTSLLFFALAESQSSAAPQDLSMDRAASLFAGAVHSLAKRRFKEAWNNYFPPNYVLLPFKKPVRVAVMTSHLQQVLLRAGKTARNAGRSEIMIDDLVISLLSLSEGRHAKALDHMGIPMPTLLGAYQNALIGQIGTTILSDAATAKDRLGYENYAKAIAKFLLDSTKSAPLSISIQAPWGAGKSSLMHQIRRELDPNNGLDQDNTQPGAPSGPLRLKHVLKFLNQDKKSWLKRVLDFLNRTPKPPESETFNPERRWTVWFNAWKYDTSEQVWAGLVDTIVGQISARLPPIKRELFLLRLQLARIDDGVVRRKIYDRILTTWWNKVRAWAAATVALIAGSFGAHKVAETLPIDPIWLKIFLWAPSGTIALLVIYLIATYVKSNAKTQEERASFSLAPYLKVPDYNLALGTIHHIHDDLIRVLDATPKDPDGKKEEHLPIVIFIDDLDRCSPSKVAAVVEGVCMFLASHKYRCMFVIGIDPQMIAAALEDAHSKVRDQLPSYERTVPLGWRFMDKFIQLPFTIPPSNKVALKSYVSWLCEPAEAPSTDNMRNVKNSSTAAPQNEPSAGAARSGPLGSGGPAKKISGEITTPSIPLAVKEFKESRDVGFIIQEAADHTSGNPREIKRLANLARLYLGLRNTRRSADPTWRSPDLSQYSRWIVVALMWPDMMRWLQWGADEAIWPESELSFGLNARRLRKLETLACQHQRIKDWKAALKEDLFVPVEKESDWAADPKLFEFFQVEGRLPSHQRLSTALSSGFW